jgi:hypothetical protein
MNFESHKEFLLAALRAGSLRCKLFDAELTSIGVSLKHDMISPEIAVKWIRDMDLMWLVAPVPDAVAAVTVGLDAATPIEDSR